MVPQKYQCHPKLGSVPNYWPPKYRTHRYLLNFQPLSLFCICFGSVITLSKTILENKMMVSPLFNILGPSSGSPNQTQDFLCIYYLRNMQDHKCCHIQFRLINIIIINKTIHHLHVILNFITNCLRNCIISVTSYFTRFTVDTGCGQIKSLGNQAKQ